MKKLHSHTPCSIRRYIQLCGSFHFGHQSECVFNQLVPLGLILMRVICELTVIYYDSFTTLVAPNHLLPGIRKAAFGETRVIASAFRTSCDYILTGFLVLAKVIKILPMELLLLVRVK